MAKLRAAHKSPTGSPSDTETVHKTAGNEIGTQADIIQHGHSATKKAFVNTLAISKTRERRYKSLGGTTDHRSHTFTATTKIPMLPNNSLSLQLHSPQVRRSLPDENSSGWQRPRNSTEPIEYIHKSDTAKLCPQQEQSNKHRSSFPCNPSIPQVDGLHDGLLPGTAIGITKADIRRSLPSRRETALSPPRGHSLDHDLVKQGQLLPESVPTNQAPQRHAKSEDAITILVDHFESPIPSGDVPPATPHHRSDSVEGTVPFPALYDWSSPFTPLSSRSSPG